MKTTYKILLAAVFVIAISGATSAAVIYKFPELIVASMENYQQKMMKKQEEASKTSLSSRSDEILNDPTDPFVGPKDSKKIIVEFFDYNCGYCKKAFSEIAQIKEKNPDVKIIFKEFPIFGPPSEAVSRVALAVHKIAPDKYYAFHSKLMEFKGDKTPEVLNGFAKELGIAIDIKTEIEKPEYAEKIKRDQELATSLGIRGTPGFIINGELIPGYISYEELIGRVNAAPNAGK